MYEEIKLHDSSSIENKIFQIRGVPVMLDRDLANFFQIETRALKQAVKRNKLRFPPSFLLEIVEKEIDYLVSQNVIPSKKSAGGAVPFALTEQGVAMLSAVLK